MDMLATPEQLALLMQDTGLDEATATLLLEMATAEVQAMCGQRLVLVEDDEITLMGIQGLWLELPERPVVEVAEVTVDGEAVEYTRFGAKLYRSCGWATCYEPTTVAVTYTHGYAEGDQNLGLAMSATLGLARQAAVNPSGVESESIDDYRISYAASLSTAAAVAANLRNALRRRYGDRAGLVRLG